MALYDVSTTERFVSSRDAIGQLSRDLNSDWLVVESFDPFVCLCADKLLVRCW